jgi:hypothetical protein
VVPIREQDDAAFSAHQGGSWMRAPS